jgi:hypothetical protein
MHSNSMMRRRRCKYKGRGGSSGHGRPKANPGATSRFPLLDSCIFFPMLTCIATFPHHLLLVGGNSEGVDGDLALPLGSDEGSPASNAVDVAAGGDLGLLPGSDDGTPA